MHILPGMEAVRREATGCLPLTEFDGREVADRLGGHPSKAEGDDGENRVDEAETERMLARPDRNE